uniref:BEN domain-containing protein n=1 Tax=Magallana gigas TaxID=29159 RepID=K1S613_MAGGI
MPRFPSIIDEASKKWALVLFDWDGCTAIIESKRLVGKEDRKVGSKFKLSFDGRLHEVEILGFGYEDRHLHAKDNQWDRSTRAKAIAAVRDARELTRRGKYGGYLDIHDSDNSDEDEEAIFSPDTSHLRTRANPNCRKTTSKKQPQKTSTPSTQQQAQQRPQETQRKHIEGTNGRSVTILYEGSGDYEGHSSPKRQPCSFEDLTSDQVDIILNQVESAQKNLISTMTMTDDIVIVQSEEDIASLCKDCNGTHHSQTSVQTQLKDIKSSQKALEKKVDSLLEILTTFVKKQETCVTIDLNTSSFVIEPESTPPSKVTKALNNILTTSVMSTTAHDTSAAKIPFNTSILDNTCETSTTRNNSLGNTLIGSTPSMFITSSMVGTSTPVTSFETTSREEPRVLLMDASNDELPPPVCETIAELVLVEENEENVAPSLESRFANQMNKPRLQRMKRFPSPCKANAITTYIRSSEDVEPGNYEILVCPDVLMEIKDRSCSDGNFLLNTARRIFKEEELEGKNYSGRKGRSGISPRRKHALQHAFAEYCSSNIDDFKRAVIALNSGIRGMAFK